MPESITPEKMTITSLDNNETKTVQFNPSVLNRSLTVNYAKKGVLGNSHQPLEYLQTANEALSFELFFYAENEAQLINLQDTLQYLESLCYAKEDPQSIAEGSPPRVLVLWPYTLSMVTRVMSIEFSHQRFNQIGWTTQATANITFDESRITRLTRENVRLWGALRTGDETDPRSI